MKKGYIIAIVCLLLVIGGLCGGIYLDLFRTPAEEETVDLSAFQAVMQDIEDSKDVGGHLWIRTDLDGEPTPFRYEPTLSFTVEVLKEEKAALLHTVLTTDTVTYKGYYELYYENGWQAELTNGKPVMQVEETSYP